MSDFTVYPEELIARLAKIEARMAAAEQRIANLEHWRAPIGAPLAWPTLTSLCGTAVAQSDQEWKKSFAEQPQSWRDTITGHLTPQPQAL